MKNTTGTAKPQSLEDKVCELRGVIRLHRLRIEESHDQMWDASAAMSDLLLQPRAPATIHHLRSVK